jgi:hypothetical protein
MNLPPDLGLWSWIGYWQVKVYRLRIFIVALSGEQDRRNIAKALELGTGRRPVQSNNGRKQVLRGHGTLFKAPCRLA